MEQPNDYTEMLPKLLNSSLNNSGNFPDLLKGQFSPKASTGGPGAPSQFKLPKHQDYAMFEKT